MTAARPLRGGGSSCARGGSEPGAESRDTGRGFRDLWRDLGGVQEGERRTSASAWGGESGPREGPSGVGTREAVAGQDPLTCPGSPCWAAGSRRPGPPKPEGASSRLPAPCPGPRLPRCRLPPPPPLLAGPWSPPLPRGKLQWEGERHLEGPAARLLRSDMLPAGSDGRRH